MQNVHTDRVTVCCIFHQGYFCVSFDVLGFRQAQIMAFAIGEINRNSNLLPNVTLGYSLYDNCVKLAIGFRAALSLASGQEEQFILEETCEGSPPVLGIVGDSSSTRSIAISTVLGLYRVPMVSFLQYHLIMLLKHFDLISNLMSVVNMKQSTSRR